MRDFDESCTFHVRAHVSPTFNVLVQAPLPPKDIPPATKSWSLWISFVCQELIAWHGRLDYAIENTRHTKERLKAEVTENYWNTRGHGSFTAAGFF